MSLNKGKKLFQKKYKVSNLYAGRLGYVTKKGNNLISIDEKGKRIIIYKKVAFDRLVDEYVGQDIFTGRKYFFWSGNKYSATIYGAVGNYAIFKSVPMDYFFSIPKKYVDDDELLEIYKEINSILNENKEPIKNEENNENEIVTDSILKTILETSEMVKDALIDEGLKKSIIQDLNELGEYYVNEKIKLGSTTNNSLSFENDYSIRMYVIKRLAEIEVKLNNPELVKVHSLKKQYKQFQKQLNESDNN